MSAPLTAFLLSTHGGLHWPSPGTPIEWRPDHVLLDDTDGTVAALAFEATGATRVACERVLVAPQREAVGPDGIEDLRLLQSFANATGAHFARPGAGPAASRCGATSTRSHATRVAPVASNASAATVPSVSSSST